MRRFYMSIQDDMMSKYEGRYFSIEYYPQYCSYEGTGYVGSQVAKMERFFICFWKILPELELFYAVTDKTSYQLYDSDSYGKLIEWTCPKEIYIDKFNSVDDVSGVGVTDAIWVQTYNDDVKNSVKAYTFTRMNKNVYAPGFGEETTAFAPYRISYVFKERTAPLDISPMFMTMNEYGDLMCYIGSGVFVHQKNCLLTADLSHLDTSIYTGSENWYEYA